MRGTRFPPPSPETFLAEPSLELGSFCLCRRDGGPGLPGGQPLGSCTLPGGSSLLTLAKCLPQILPLSEPGLASSLGGSPWERAETGGEQAGRGFWLLPHRAPGRPGGAHRKQASSVLFTLLGPFLGQGLEESSELPRSSFQLVSPGRWDGFRGLPFLGAPAERAQNRRVSSRAARPLT